MGIPRIRLIQETKANKEKSENVKVVFWSFRSTSRRPIEYSSCAMNSKTNEINTDNHAGNPKTISKAKAEELLELAMHLLNELNLDGNLDGNLDSRQEGDFWGLVKQLPRRMAESVVN